MNFIHFTVPILFSLEQDVDPNNIFFSSFYFPIFLCHHPLELTSYTANLWKILLKKKGKKRVQEGGYTKSLEKQKTVNMKENKETNDYGNLARGNPLRSKLKTFWIVWRNTEN